VKILAITSRVPWPLEKGDKLRAYHQIRELSRKHEVILCAMNDVELHPEAMQELNKICSEVHVYPITKMMIARNLASGLISGLPLQVAYFTDRGIKRSIDSLIQSAKPDRIFCQLIRTAEYARHHRSIPSTLDYMDVFSKGIERRIDKVGALRKFPFKLEWKRLLKYEEAVFADFDAHTIISKQDRMFLPAKERERIRVIPNGVDTVFFHPMNAVKDFQLLFNGNMNYPPNIESAVYIVEKILPIVWRSRPEVRLLISGATPAERVRSLASERVVISGWVDDIRQSFARSTMLVAPMQSSIGLQNKLLEAMAMQVPCITSELSNNAIQAIPDKEILVADRPDQYAAHILSLLADPQKAETIARNGRELVLERFSWEQTCAELEEVIVGSGKEK
jgi:sugar transferase (PEP-CTERM/EpsH1 system associated)